MPRPRRLAWIGAVAVLVAGCAQLSITVDGWAVSCGVVDPAVCRGVAGLALNNLARDRPSGPLSVVDRPVCPAVPDWADGRRCWQVDIPVGGDSVCMVVAIRYDGRYAQVAGDSPGLVRPAGAPRGCP